MMERSLELVHLVLAVAAYATAHPPATPLPTPTLEDRPRIQSSGIAKHYSPGIMDMVAENRGMTIPRGYYGAARVDCSTIGDTFYATVNGVMLHYIQIDCSQYKDAQRHRKEGLILEISWEAAVKVGITGEGRGKAVIWQEGRRR
jgi:hypothetical protein